jgi:hypothetical protein
VQVLNTFSNLLIGEIKNVLPPRIVKVTATGCNNKPITSEIKVYPGNITSHEVDFSKVFSWVKNINDKLEKTCKFLPVKFAGKFLVGKVAFEGGWAEDPGTNLVFYRFNLKGGFDPLIGYEARLEFPLMWILSAIPAAIRKYVADLKGIFTLGGGVGFTLSIQRSSAEKYKGLGEAIGVILASAAIHADLFSGKLLAAEALLGSQISVTVSTELAKEPKQEKWKFENKVKAEWGGLKGKLVWSLFDGKYSKGDEIVIVEPITLYP